jgi:hypothetical protein
MRVQTSIWLWVTVGILLSHIQVRAQNADPSLFQHEDSLKYLAREMVNARDAEAREAACLQFIPKLVQALKTPGSFSYPFDSLAQVSILYPEDSAFRIFTWAFTPNNMTFRFYGALQMNTPDGSLKLFPLFDNSRFTNDLDTITSNKAWVGALYYNLITTKDKNKKYYTLFGWHGYNFRSNEKLLEVLTFEDGKPVFGAPVFNFSQDSVPGATRNRFLLIYKRDGNAGLNYDPEEKMIVFDHLVPLNGQADEKYTFVPDGTYEGFTWKKGAWVHIPKIFHTVSDKPPLPAPMEFKNNILEKQKMGRDTTSQ